MPRGICFPDFQYFCATDPESLRFPFNSQPMPISMSQLQSRFQNPSHSLHHGLCLISKESAPVFLGAIAHSFG